MCSIESAYQRAQSAVGSRSRVPGVPDAPRWPAHAAGYARERPVALANCQRVGRADVAEKLKPDASASFRPASRRFQIEHWESTKDF